MNKTKILMRTKGLIHLIVLSFLIFSCSSENGEDILEGMTFDCTQSDLALTIQSQTDPTCSEAGSIVIDASGGTAPLTFSLDDNAAQSSGTFENLNAGTYAITVTDSNDCTKTVSATLASDSGFTASASVGDCGDNTIVINVVPAGDYTFSINGGADQSGNTFADLNPGTYEITVTDNGGCISTLSNLKVEASISLATDIMPIINANCALPSCHGGSRSPNLSSAANIIASSNRIKSRTSAGTMPPSNSLPQSQVDLIAGWVDCGAQDN